MVMGAIVGMRMPDPGSEPLIRPGLIVLKEERVLQLTEVSWQLIRVQHLEPYHTLLSNLRHQGNVIQEIVVAKNPTPSTKETLLDTYSHAIRVGLRRRLQVTLKSIEHTALSLKTVYPDEESTAKCKPKRVARAPFSFIGTIMHDMFSIMDETGERLVQDLDTKVDGVLTLSQKQATIVTGLIKSFKNLQVKVDTLIAQMTQSFTVVNNELKELAHFLLMSTNITILEDLVNSARTEVDALCDTIQQGIKGQVARELISKEAMDTILSNIGTLKGLEYDKRNLLEVQNVVYCRETILYHVIVKIPGEITYNLFTPYRTSVPVGTHFFQFNTPAHFAVPRQNTNIVIEFMTGQLEGCTTTPSSYICDSHRLSFVNPNESCPLLILSGDIKGMQQVPHFCGITLLRHFRPFFHFLQNGERVVYSVLTNTSSKLTCGGETTFHKIHGTGIIKDPSWCTLRVGNTVLRSPRMKDFPDDVLDVKTIDLVEMQVVLNESYHAPHLDHQPSTNLRFHKLQRKTEELLSDQEGLEKEISNYRELHHRVETHGVVGISLFSTTAVLIVAVLIAVGWLIGKSCFKSGWQRNPSKKEVMNLMVLNRDCSAPVGENVAELAMPQTTERIHPGS